jgi:hypothetical protein
MSDIVVNFWLVQRVVGHFYGIVNPVLMACGKTVVKLTYFCKYVRTKLYGNFRKADFEIFFNTPKWSFKFEIHVDIILK